MAYPRPSTRSTHLTLDAIGDLRELDAAAFVAAAATGRGVGRQ